MWKYATRRVLTMIPILIGVSMVVFLLVASLPGDAVDAHAGGNITAEKIAQNKALLGIRQTDTGKIRKLGKSCDQRRFWYLDQLQDSGNRSHR